MVNYTFDPESIGVGLLAGWASAYGVYRARHVLASTRDSLTNSASSAQEYATRGADKRYIDSLIKECEAGHLAGRIINLSDIAIEPRFIPAPPLVEPPDDDVVHSVFHVVPFTPDHPYLQAPYNVETFSIETLSRGDRAIALLGLAGSGRTTALKIIALNSIGKIHFEEEVDIVQQQIETSYEDLPSDERAKRITEFDQIAQRARNTLSNNNDNEVDEATSKTQKQRNLPLFNRLTPFYVHLDNLSVSLSEFGQNIDPAEPLLRALQQHVKGLTARTLVLSLYERLKEGNALLLIDGFDELPQNAQPRVLNWLSALIEQYSNNFIIVTGSTNGYGNLAQIGLTPVFMRPWDDQNVTQVTEKWQQNWNKINKSTIPTLDVIEDIQYNSRALSPFEITLKIWSQYADPLADYETWIRQAIEYHLPNKESLGIVLPRLAQMAALQLNEGYISATRLDELSSEHPKAMLSSQTQIPQETSEPDDNLDVFFDDNQNLEEDEEDLDTLFAPDDNQQAQVKDAQIQDKESLQLEGSKSAREQERWLQSLWKSGLLVRFKGRHYRFLHTIITDYLASLTLVELDTDTLIEQSYDTRWQGAFAQATNHMSIDAVAEERLNAPKDVLYNNVLELSRWVANSSLQIDWKGKLLRLLGNIFVAPHQFRLVRERVAAALIELRDRNTLIVFEKSLDHPNADVRRLACLGLGVIRANKQIRKLSGLLEDKNPDVQLAAGIALGAIGTQDALEEMSIALTEGSEQVRQAIAEALASIPNEGYPTLYDAIHHEDMMLRRAAIFGLRRIQTTWALVTLYRTSLEDKQWYVRSAAEEALRTMKIGNTAIGVKAYSEVENIIWLREWLAKQGADAIEDDQTPENILLKALEEGDIQTQQLSITTMGQLGLVNFIDNIYTLLRHQNAEVRQATFSALGDLQLQTGVPLPSPI